MADYTGMSSNTCCRSLHSLSYPENIDPSWELTNPFIMSMTMNNPISNLLQNQSNLDYNQAMMMMGLCSSDHHFLSPQTTSQVVVHSQVPLNPQPVVVSSGEECSDHQRNKRKAEEMPENSSFNSSLTSSDAITRKNSPSRGKRAKSNEKKGGEKAEEVVHVRARRGQATDSHSIAERVRRGKINERLKCLQDIVPGCYKTMGMAVMLDEIINYVQSLQNQVEFLSMKLTAASQFHDFNAETEANHHDKMQNMKAQISSHEAQDLQRMMRNNAGNDQELADRKSVV